MVPSTADADDIVGNGARTFLAKGTATFSNEKANLPNKAQINSPDYIILDNGALFWFLVLN